MDPLLFAELADDPCDKPRRGIGGRQSAVNKTDVWLTPPEIVTSLGTFDLDPCAPATRPWDTAREHYAERGLELPWFGRVWMHPPYGSPRIIGPWMRRLARHGRGTALIFARTETTVFFETVWGAATGLLFLRRRRGALSDWRDLLADYFRENPGPTTIAKLYEALSSHPKLRRRRHARAKIRQTLQRGPFRPLQRGLWEADVAGLHGQAA